MGQDFSRTCNLSTNPSRVQEDAEGAVVRDLQQGDEDQGLQRLRTRLPRGEEGLHLSWSIGPKLLWRFMTEKYRLQHIFLVLYIFIILLNFSLNSLYFYP